MDGHGAPARRARRLALAVVGMAGGLTLSPAMLRASERVALALPQRGSGRSLTAALAQRRSVRSYAAQAVALSDISELLWAAQGISSDRGLRTAPSAGALYPLELHVIARRVDGLAAGVYRYSPTTHTLEPTLGKSAVSPLMAAAGNQPALASAPAILVIAAVHARTAARYGARASRYVAIEVGAAAQNVALEAASLALGTVLIGAFDDDAVARALQLPPGEQPLVLMPVGKPG